MSETKKFLEKWYQGYRSEDPKFLDEILDESVVFFITCGLQTY
jgi:hypothetical protein